MKIAKRVIIVLACWATAGWAAAHFPPTIHLEVWSSHGFDDPFSSDEPIDVFFQADAFAYLTVYQVNPWGGVEILYPRPQHRWIAVMPGRTYCLSDLASDLQLYYDGAEGSAYFGIIATPEPIDLAVWLESGFQSCGLHFGRRPGVAVSFDIGAVLGRVQADLRFRIGNRCEPSFFNRVIRLRPRSSPPQLGTYRPFRPGFRAWGNRSYWPPASPAPSHRDLRQPPDRRSRFEDAPPARQSQRDFSKSRSTPSRPPGDSETNRRVRRPKH